MLDEVNNLVDLMSAEKLSLQARISDLECCNEQLQSESRLLQDRLEQEQAKHSEVHVYKNVYSSGL